MEVAVDQAEALCLETQLWVLLIHMHLKPSRALIQSRAARLACIYVCSKLASFGSSKELSTAKIA